MEMALQIRTIQINGGTQIPTPDTDGVEYANHLDLDADNDGIYDVVEGLTVHQILITMA